MKAPQYRKAVGEHFHKSTGEFNVMANENTALFAKIPSVDRLLTTKTMEEIALAADNVKVHTDGKTVRKVIVIKGRMINIVAN